REALGSLADSVPVVPDQIRERLVPARRGVKVVVRLIDHHARRGVGAVGRMLHAGVELRVGVLGAGLGTGGEEQDCGECGNDGRALHSVWFHTRLDRIRGLAGFRSLGSGRYRLPWGRSGLGRGVTSPTTRTTTGYPSRRLGTRFPTSGVLRDTSTSTAGEPRTSPSPVPTTPGTFISSAVWARRTSATV